MDIAAGNRLGVNGRRPVGTVRLVDISPFALGAVEVYPAKRRIVIAGSEILLEPKVMQVLVALVQARGEVLSVDDLLDQCWDGRIVSDAAIYRVIGKIRELERQSDGTFELENVAKVGYRLITADVRELPAKIDRTTPENARGLTTRRWVIATGTSAALLGADSWWLGRESPQDKKIDGLLLRAKQAMQSSEPDATRQGIGFIEEAVRLKPDDPVIWGSLALARAYAAEFAPPHQRARLVAASQNAANRAKSLDPRQADAHAAMALLPHYFGDWYVAERRFDAVLRLDPGHRAVLNEKNFLLVGVGRVNEGCRGRISSITEDVMLDATFQYRLVYAYWLLGMIGDADRSAERALQLWPRHPGCWLSRLLVLLNTGRPDRALMLISNEAGRPNLPPAMIEAMRGVATAQISRKQSDVALAADGLIALVSKGPSLSIMAIAMLNGMGSAKAALDVAEAFLTETGPIMAEVRWRSGDASMNDSHHRKTHMLFLPNAHAMRSDPRFASLVERIGLVRYWQQARVTPDYLIAANAKTNESLPQGTL